MKVLLPFFILICAFATFGQANITFSGGNGAPLTTTVQSPVYYRITENCNANGMRSNARFVFQKAGSILQNSNAGDVTGTIGFSINGGASMLFDSESTVNQRASSPEFIRENDLIFLRRNFLFSENPIGSTVVLSAGTATTTGNVADAPPVSFSYPSYVSWIVLDNTRCTGSDEIRFTLLPNNDLSPRSGYVRVLGGGIMIQQSGLIVPPTPIPTPTITPSPTPTPTPTSVNCAFTISPETASFTQSGGSGSISVQTQTDCSWSAASDQPWVADTSCSGMGNGTVNYTVAEANISVLRSATTIVGDKSFIVYQSPSATQTPTPTPTPSAPLLRKIVYDFDGDRKDDVSIYRDGMWWYAASSNSNQHSAIQFGVPGDKTVPADYDGDGKTDAAVFRDGFWHILKSSTNSYSGMQFGFPTDIPVPADYDGDGRADIAVYRPSDGYWYIMQSLRGFRAVQFGAATDIPVAADYDGDWLTDIAVYRPSNGIWYVLQSSQGFKAVQWGEAADIPVVGDYDGDGKADAAVFRPSNGTWYLMRSRDGFAGLQFGQAGDKPVPADYDGDGRTDYAVFRDGTWYLVNSTIGFKMISFGYPTDKPVPNSFIR